MNPLINATIFLIKILFNFYILILMLRLILQWGRISTLNPLSHFLLTVTNPVIKPLQRFFPKRSKIEWATLVTLILLQMITLALISWLSADIVPNIAALIVLSIASLLKLLINIFFYAIIIMIILSWVNPTLQNPLTNILFYLTEPLMRPARRFIPPIGGFDFSPIAVIIVLQLLIIIFVQPLLHFGLLLTVNA